MNKNSCYIPVAKPILSKNVKKYVLDAINKNALSGTFGSYIFKFEDDFAKFVKQNLLYLLQLAPLHYIQQ